jgi:hypothetical protein
MKGKHQDLVLLGPAPVEGATFPVARYEMGWWGSSLGSECTSHHRRDSGRTGVGTEIGNNAPEQ